MSSSFRRAKTRLPIETNARGCTNIKSNNNSPNIVQTVLKRRGTKPWVGGLTLTSTGLRELDAICGGGQPLGTAILVEEDRWTQDLGIALARYWAAEAVSQEQNLALVVTNSGLNVDVDLTMDDDDLNAHQSSHESGGLSALGANVFLSILPRDLHLDKAISKLGEQEKKKNRPDISTAFSKLQPFAIVEEDDFQEGDEHDTERSAIDGKADSGLQNAWQYKISVQRERLGAAGSSQTKGASSIGGKVFCHSFDLGGRMYEQQSPKSLFDNEYITIVNCGISENPSLDANICHIRLHGMQLFQKMLGHIQMQLSRFKDGVVRLLLLNAPIRASAIALPLQLSFIRSNSLPVVVMITVRPWLCSTMPYLRRKTSASSSITSLISLRRSCDAIFTCEGFASLVAPPPPEFRDLAGILSIRKMALQTLFHFCNSSSKSRPPANRYGMKRDRRKIHIQMLHLPPEDYSAGGSSVGNGVRSGAGFQSKKEEGIASKMGLGCASSRS